MQNSMHIEKGIKTETKYVHAPRCWKWRKTNNSRYLDYIMGNKKRFFIQHNKVEYTGWPRKNATTLIVNIKDIINKMEWILISLCGKFIFQQNDIMIINCG